MLLGVLPFWASPGPVAALNPCQVLESWKRPSGRSPTRAMMYSVVQCSVFYSVQCTLLYRLAEEGASGMCDHPVTRFLWCCSPVAAWAILWSPSWRHCNAAVISTVVESGSCG